MEMMMEHIDWETPRDELLDQLSNLLTELQNHEEGLLGTFDLLDNLDGTRRAIDRLSAVITDKFTNPSSIEYFSPAVTRPLSTSTDVSNSSSEQSYESHESHLTQLSSPTTLISDYDDDINHRRRLLDEDEELLLARAAAGIAGLDEDEDEDDQDQDERLERLSFLLSSVLKEANDAIKDYEVISEDPEEEAQAEIVAEEAEVSEIRSERGEVTTRCSSRLSTSTSTLMIEELQPGLRSAAPSRKVSMYEMPSLVSQETIRPMLQDPPTAPPTPPPVEEEGEGYRGELLPSPDHLSVSSLTSSAETIIPICHTPKPEVIITTTDFDDESQEPVDGEVKRDVIAEIFGDDQQELSLDYLLGDYLNEVIMDVRRNEFVGARFWIFLISVMGMWTWMFITDMVNNFIGNLACACRSG
ncbi:hypothetical protein TWF173_011407 [Orbilia oligospora]|uniref:Uncharacterized protein n=1 Tax=Orbilia oligospora TaxID=2813651 RepID=A0A7C8VT99_ORBOL|nr:hypothetical protein TWF970_010442 [Orbilia oligospora]KAF3309100.1 hypothetical protein TWF173_011407 [Orbilia oligospora]